MLFGPTGQVLRVLRQFAAQCAVIATRVAFRITRQHWLRVEQMQQHARALDVPQEPQAQSGPLARAGDQAGNVCDDEALFARGRLVPLGRGF